MQEASYRILERASGASGGDIIGDVSAPGYISN